MNTKKSVPGMYFLFFANNKVWSYLLCHPNNIKSRNSDSGSHSRLSSTIPTIYTTYGTCASFFCRDKTPTLYIPPVVRHLNGHMTCVLISGEVQYTLYIARKNKLGTGRGLTIPRHRVSGRLVSLLLLQGIILNRTYGTHKNLYS